MNQIEEQKDRGEKLSIQSYAVGHPRITLGGGTFLLSLLIDLIIRFDITIFCFCAILALALGWQADKLMSVFFAAPDQEDVDRFVEESLGDNYPVYADRSFKAILFRFIGRGNYETIEEQEEDTPQQIASPKQEGLTCDQLAIWFDQDRITVDQFIELLRYTLSPESESSESVKRLVEPGEDGESTVKSHPVSPSLSPTVSPEDEQAVVRAAFALIAEKGKVSREEIKEALGWNNKKHWIIKATCDKYDIAMPPGRK